MGTLPIELDSGCSDLLPGILYPYSPWSRALSRLAEWLIRSECTTSVKYAILLLRYHRLLDLSIGYM